MLQGSAVQRISDVGLGVAIPLHSHMAMNSVITDYVPKGPFQSARLCCQARAACLCAADTCGPLQVHRDGAPWPPRALLSLASRG